MNFPDLRVGDIIGKNGPDGELFVIVAVFDNKVIAQRTIDITDLSGWEKINLYGSVATPNR